MSSSRRMSSLVSAIVLVVLWGVLGHTRHGDLPNRIPEPPPYNVTEAEVYPPPYEDKWTTINHPLLSRRTAPPRSSRNGQWTQVPQRLSQGRNARMTLRATDLTTGPRSRPPCGLAPDSPWRVGSHATASHRSIVACLGSQWLVCL